MHTFKNQSLGKQADIKNITDKELIQKYQQSEDISVLGELYKRHTQFVFLISMKYLKDPERAEDMSMQIFEKLLKELKNQEIRNFKAWLHTVTRNECLMLLRADQSELKKQRTYKKEEENIMENSVELHHSDKKAQEKRLDLLHEAVKSLKPEQQKCVDLFYLKEKSYQEVAEDTGYSMKQVKSYIQNGKRNLKIFMERAGLPMLTIAYMLEKLL